ncbi:MAG: phosphotransferase [Asgard group archaeon]|nr:phosphotransferase [Asgard group archaeon]
MFEVNNGCVNNMMNVDIMSEIVEPFDNKEPTIGDYIIEKWIHDEGTLRMRRVSANAIFEFQNKKQHFILRMAPDSERTKKQIHSELDFMIHLKNKNFSVPEIIPSINGNLIEELKTESRNYFAVVFQKCPGKHIEIDEIPLDQVVEWGRLTALIHQHSQTFEPRNNRKRRYWTDDVMKTLQLIPKEDNELKEILLDLVDEINEFPKDEYFGLIHFDLELDNILWNNNNYYVIDFDDAAYYHYIADLSFALEEIREKKTDVSQNILNNFVSGYEQIKSLPSNWKEQFDCFCKMLDVLKYARTLHAYENTNPKKYPDWLAELHDRHMNNLKDIKKKLIQEKRKTN